MADSGGSQAKHTERSRLEVEDSMGRQSVERLPISGEPTFRNLQLDASRIVHCVPTSLRHGRAVEVRELKKWRYAVYEVDVALCQNLGPLNIGSEGLDGLDDTVDDELHMPDMSLNVLVAY